MRLLTLYLALLICPLSWSQFTVIPTGTTATIGELALHGDTLLISAHPDYFAKYSVGEDVLVSLEAPGPSNYGNTNLQVVNDKYYILSSQGSPYDHNLILRSTDGGTIWDTLADLPGLYYTMTLIDTSFGILAGSFGSHAITDGSDSNWIMQDSMTGTITASAAYGDSTILMTSLLNMSYLTHDRGQTWIPNSGAPSIVVKQIQFLNADTIFLIASLDGTNPTCQFKTSDNSAYSWSTHYYGLNSEISSYEFYSAAKDMQINDDGTGYVLAYVEKTVYNSVSTVIDKMAIFQTNDYGETWTPFLTDFSEVMYDMIFLNDSIAFIGGANGLLIKWDLTVPLLNVLTLNETPEGLPVARFFPNPANGSAILIIDETYLPNTLTIVNQLGQIVYTQAVTENASYVSLTNLSNGVYYYSVGETRGQLILNNE